MEQILDSAVDWLHQIDGAPAGLLCIFVCIALGYVLRLIQSFPNNAIPVVAILAGGAFYPLIADANNDIPLRVWIVRNLGIGLVYGLIAWLLHNQVLSRLEDKLQNVPLIGKLLGNTPPAPNPAPAPDPKP